MASGPRTILLAAPRGYCAGVDRAVQTVEKALDLYGPPVYVRKEIVHNKHVVREPRAARRDLRRPGDRGARRARPSCSPPTAWRPRCTRTRRSAGLNTIDATCPLVTKVHVEARKFAADGYTIVLVGHEGHEEVEGTTGEAPEHIVLVQTEEDAERLEVDDPDKVAFITQTTLSVDETMGIIRKLRERFPNMVGPRTDDICYATQNRQDAVKQLAPRCDLVLVIGSRNSSNSNRLVEVARQHGAASHLIDNEHEVQGGVAGGRRDGRHHLRRERARGAGPAADRVLPRARGGGRLGAGGDRGGRALHAPQGHPPAAHARAADGLRREAARLYADRRRVTSAAMPGQQAEPTDDQRDDRERVGAVVVALRTSMRPESP